MVHPEQQSGRTSNAVSLNGEIMKGMEKLRYLGIYFEKYAQVQHTGRITKTQVQK